MALNTIDTYLLYKTGTPAAYAKLVDIKDYPDIFGDVDKLETTTLSNKSRTYINGIVDFAGGDFTCNFNKDDFNTIKALEGAEQDLQIAFGYANSNYGSDASFSFKGYISVKVSGKGIDEVREMIVTVIPSSEITVA